MGLHTGNRTQLKFNTERFIRKLITMFIIVTYRNTLELHKITDIRELL